MKALYLRTIGTNLKRLGQGVDQRRDVDVCAALFDPVVQSNAENMLKERMRWIDVRHWCLLEDGHRILRHGRLRIVSVKRTLETIDRSGLDLRTVYEVGRARKIWWHAVWKAKCEGARIWTLVDDCGCKRRRRSRAPLRSRWSLMIVRPLQLAPLMVCCKEAQVLML